MEDLPWSWEIEATGGGPHFYLALEFDAQQELARLAGPLLGGFERRSDTLWEQPLGSEWRYATVAIHSNRIGITRGWAWSKSRDARLVRRLLHLPGLLQWRAFAGGEWCAPEFFRGGNSAQSLIEYSRAQVPQPDFDLVLRHLRESLEARGLSEKYTLGEPGLGRGTMRVPVLYNVPCVDGAWQIEPAGSELIAVAREVSDKSDVPATASAASLHAPDNFHVILGGSFSFGARRQ